MSTNRHRFARAFTLVESLAASVVLAVCVVAMATALSAASQQTLVAQRLTSATSLASQLLTEISAKPLLDPNDSSRTPGAEFAQGESGRATFDNIDDYHGYTDATGDMLDRAGNAIPASSSGLANGWSFTRSVRVEYGARPVGHVIAPANDFALVTITVTDGAGVTYTTSRLFTVYTRAR